MDFKKGLHSLGIGRILCAISIFALTCGMVFAQDGKAVAAPESLRVITLKNITVQQGREYLSKLGITNVSQLPGSNTLLVTDSPRQLVKATAVIDLVDCYEKYDIETVFTMGQDKPLPSNYSIESQVGDILIGTFANTPVKGAKARAIIDFHENGVVAVAPKAQMDKIIKVIAQLQKEAKEAAKKAAKLAKEQRENQNEQQEIQNVQQEPNEPNNGLSVELVKSGEKAKDNVQNNSEERAVPAVATSKQNEKEPFDRLLQLLEQSEKSSKQKQGEKVGQTAGEPIDANQSKIIELPENISLGQLLDLGTEHLKLNYIYDVNQVDTRMGLDISGNVAVSELYSLIESVLAVKGYSVESNENFITIKPVAKEVEETSDKAKAGTIDIDTEANAPKDASYSYEPNDINNGNDELTLELPEKLEIIHLLRLAGEYLHLDYMYDPAEVKGEIYLSLQQSKIKVKDLYPLMQRVLEFKGFSMTRHNNIVTIVPTDKADVGDPRFVSDKEKLTTSDIVVKRVFRLNYIDTQTAETLLTSMKYGISYASVPSRGMLIVTGYTHRMPKIEELLKIIDVPGKKKQYRFRVMQHTVAVNLLPRVQSLAAQLGAVSITIETTAATPQGQENPGMQNPMSRRLPPNIGGMQPNMPSQNNMQPKSAGQSGTPTGDSVYLEADERTNRILMIGLAEQLDIVEKLIDSLDLEQQDLRIMKSYEIQHADAAEVVEKLGELGIINASTNTNSGTNSMSGMSANRLTARPAVGGGPGKETPDAMQASDSVKVLEEPLVVIIASTNSLLVKATVQQHQEIASIISYIDREQTQTSLPYVVYQLENQDPNVLGNTLAQLIQGKTGMDSSTISGGPMGSMSSMPGQENMNQTKFSKPTASAGTSVARNNEEDITIVPDGKTRSMIVYASKKNQQWIGSIIKELDSYMPQVLLDVTLVEVSKDDEFQYDLTMSTTRPAADVGRTYGASSGFGGGQFFYSDDTINIILNALDAKNTGRILAKPKLLVRDNEVGTIKTNNKKTIVSPTTIINPGSVGVPSTSSTSVQLTAYDEGITMDIQPHVSKGDELQLSIMLTRIDFQLQPDYSLKTPEGDLKGPTPPNLLSTDVKTAVTLPDNSTIILGGLEKINQSKEGDKVPILGDIPLIGGLFKTTKNSDVQNKLYVFVKAHILRPGEESSGKSDLKNISNENKAYFEKYEDKFQKHQSWPGVDPKPLDPVKILEAN